MIPSIPVDAKCEIAKPWKYNGCEETDLLEEVLLLRDARQISQSGSAIHAWDTEIYMIRKPIAFDSVV